MFSLQLAIPSGSGCPYCPPKDSPCLGSLWLCHGEVAASCFACLAGQPFLLCKWKSKWPGPSASQSFAMCLCMTRCPGMSLGHPRLFPNPEKYFVKQQLSPNSNTTVPLCPIYSSCLCPHVATINSSCTSFFRVCLENFLLDQILIFSRV